MRTRGRLLAGLLVLAAGVRLAAALLVAPGYQPRLDEEAYQRLALGILAGQGLSAERGLGAVAVPGQPTSFWCVGQPAYMALLYSLLGVRPVVVFLLNALLGVATVWLSYELALRLVEWPWALAAAAIVALDPWLVRLSASLYGEPLYMPLLLAALVVLLPRTETASGWRAALAGLLLGFAALVRSTAFYFVPLVALALGWRLGRPAWRPALALLAGSAMVVAPWVARNVSVHDGLVLLDTKAGWNLYHNYHPQRHTPPLRNGHPFIPLPEGYWQLSEYERDRTLGGMAVEFVLREPLQALRRAAGHLLDLWSPLPSRHTAPGLRLLKPVLLVPFQLAAVIGLVLAWPRRRQLGVLYLLLLYYSVLHSVMVGAPRFRAPLDPILACFAVLALERGWRVWSCRRQAGV